MAIRTLSFQKAVFLDRDATVIVDMEYSADPAGLALLPGALEGLRRLQEAGYLLIIVTNQSGVARGLFSEAQVHAFHERMLALLRRGGIRIAAIHYCPHFIEGKVPEYAVECDCRKPAPGMLLRAAREHAVDLKKSWMLGDRPSDAGAGKAVGCRTIRVGRNPEWADDDIKPDFEAADLVEAAEMILREG